ncbi:MAG TPA: hypothetical protein DHW42_08760 [Candidatus Marinimicrobia bacterium]|nr:hypothetical protein [Candidatus Neomarinimicrobiota bacterium]
MRKNNLFLLIAFLPIFVLGEMDHLVISEIVLQPKEREFVKIYNLTDAALDLSNYYLTDGTDTVNGKFYYNLPIGSDFHSGSGTDFMVRFPDAYSIPAKSSILISIMTKSAYETNYGETPDLSIKEDFRHAVDTMSTIGTAPYYLDDYKETLVLFYWDGSSPTVQDVDYILWGSTDYAIDKSAVAGYAADTPVDQQKFIPWFEIFQVHDNGQKLKRISDEGTESQSGGNGITGHDETSENLDQTWTVVSVGNTKPIISSVALTPAIPTIEDEIRVSAVVSDDGSLAEVSLVYKFNGTPATAAMVNETGDSYSVTLEPFAEVGTLLYYVRAVDDTGLKDSSLTYSVDIVEPPEEITIAMIRENWSDWEGQTVTLRGVVTIGSNILRTGRTSAYFQDASGRGLNLYDGAITNLAKGDSIEVTGELDEYGGVYELKDFASSYTVLASNVPIPNVVTIPVGALVEDPTAYEGNYFQINGTVADRADNVGGGSNITIEDVTGRVTVRIWNSTNALFNSLEELVNEELDSLLQPGNMVSVKGVGSLYNNSPQVLLGYAEDVEYYIPGEPGNEKTKLSVAPYPFVPQLGEVIKYSYEYPSNCRVILRVYDMSGRFITTLEDGYYALSWHKENVWDGRNELNELVAPGNYLFHLQTTNRTTGKTRADIAPVVVGVKF